MVIKSFNYSNLRLNQVGIGEKCHYLLSMMIRLSGYLEEVSAGCTRAVSGLSVELPRNTRVASR